MSYIPRTKYSREAIRLEKIPHERNVIVVTHSESLCFHIANMFLVPGDVEKRRKSAALILSYSSF